ncbi:hypothetical protein ACQ26G_004208 [Yersinia enterocolitica]|uniref:hypothetical protein n=1 Tax=Yersinia TaxID=629 RepID=UPI001C608D83|nr:MULTISPECIES: hypothetical protein [Yersinia]MBW5814435.1 hypothetical protein [Yersinia kristensenii]MBW5831690.1 hypothetical protein [Yersinia kristensenii]MBX9498258.1 hypothetical protein [Yersinia enterocolitica]HEI6818971.1 hypothetical protein [Yersinia enterocolitica]
MPEIIGQTQKQQPGLWEQYRAFYCHIGIDKEEYSVIDFNAGGWIVEALKLFEKSKILRRMFYSVVTLGLIYVISDLITSIRWW